MTNKTLAALALLPLGLFASSASANETAASQEIVAYGQSQQDSQSRRGDHTQSRYDDDMRSRGQPMPQQDERIGIRVGGDYIYWKPYFSNMPYAFNSDMSFYLNPNSSGVYVPANGSNLNMKMKGDSGFRVWAGFWTDWQDMAFDASWTRFYTQSSESKTNSAMTDAQVLWNDYGDALFGYWNSGRTSAQQGSYNNVLFKATGDFKIEYDLLDFIFSTKYEPQTWARVMPGAGIRALFSHMQLRASQVSNYYGTAIRSAPPFNTQKQVMTQNYNSVGLVAGMRGEFDLYEHFKAITGFNAAYVVGTMYETQFATVTQGAANTDPDPLNAATDTLVTSNQTVFKPQFDMDVGLQYEWLSDEMNWGFLLEVAYEAHWLPNFVQFIRYEEYPTDSTESRNRTARRNVTEWSDLFFQGLRVRGGFTF